MLRKMSIRLHLTMLSVLLLTTCCIVLTAILNFSANSMANAIEATLMTPAQVVETGEIPSETTIAETPSTVPAIPINSSQMARKRFLWQSVFVMALVVTLGGTLTYYISGKALKPLQELSIQMKNRTVHNLSEALPMPQSNDEIAELTCSFNEMSEKLEEAFAMQKRFSQSAAHELRTPLTVLKTKVDVFNKKKEHTPQEYEKLLQVITTHTGRLSCLVKDLLNLTNMDALDLSEQVELKGLLIQVSEELSVISDKKNLAVTVDGEEEMVLSNRSLLHRAFYNLVENSIKYNVDGGKVNIHISAVEQKAVITICDTGIGIPDNARELIFEPFYRIDKSRSRQMGGAGLGLALVKSIVEKHKGTITVIENSHGGTIFEIRLQLI